MPFIGRQSLFLPPGKHSGWMFPIYIFFYSEDYVLLIPAMSVIRDFFFQRSHVFVDDGLRCGIVGSFGQRSQKSIVSRALQQNARKKYLPGTGKGKRVPKRWEQNRFWNLSNMGQHSPRSCCWIHVPATGTLCPPCCIMLFRPPRVYLRYESRLMSLAGYKLQRVSANFEWWHL